MLGIQWCSISSPLRGCRAFRSLNLEDNDKCTLNYYMYICMFKTLVSCTLPCLISTAVIGNYLTDSNISYCILDTYFNPIFILKCLYFFY